MPEPEGVTDPFAEAEVALNNKPTSDGKDIESDQKEEKQSSTTNLLSIVEEQPAQARD